MKSFIAPSLFAAFVAFVRAEDFANFDVEANEPGFFVSFFLTFCLNLIVNCLKKFGQTKKVEKCTSKYFSRVC